MCIRDRVEIRHSESDCERLQLGWRGGGVEIQAQWNDCESLQLGCRFGGNPRTVEMMIVRDCSMCGNALWLGFC